MPNYGAAGPVAIYPGQSYALFNAESPSAPQSSACVTIAKAQYSPLAFDIEFSAAPTDSLLIQGAMTDTDSAYQTLYTSTNKQQDNYADYGKFQFYRARVVSWTGGGTLTVTAHR